MTTSPEPDDIAPDLAPSPEGRPANYGLDVRRLRITRTIVFAVLAVPILLLALLAVKFVSMPITQAWHNSAYGESRYEEAIDRLEPVWVGNWFESYLPHLSRGTDLLQQDRNAEAEEELRVALETWDEGSDLNQPLHADCKIRNNLAIAIERQAVEIEDPAERADRLYEAEEIILPCMSGGGGDGEDDGEGGGEGDDESEGGGDGESEGEDQGEGGTGNEDQEETEGNGDRIREERREADEEAGNDPDDRPSEQESQGDGEGQGGGPQDPGDPERTDPDGEGDGGQTPTQDPDPEEQEKQDELDERNEGGEGGQGEGDPGSDGDPERPW